MATIPKPRRVGSEADILEATRTTVDSFNQVLRVFESEQRIAPMGTDGDMDAKLNEVIERFNTLLNRLGGAQ